MHESNPEGKTLTEKRAQYERMSMTVLKGAGVGRVNVRNDSYGDESGNHIYTVRVKNGETFECTCPADEYQPGPCKHRLACENSPLVVASAGCVAEPESVATDGGKRR